MNGHAPTAGRSLPDRGDPHAATCAVCGHRHACYLSERPSGLGDGSWVAYPVCLGCLMRAADGVSGICVDCGASA